MLKRLLAFFRKKPKQPTNILSRLQVDPKTGVGKLDRTNWSADHVEAFQEVALQHSDLPLFTGQIENGYALGAVATAMRCPQCGAATQQQYANFIYTTNIAPRTMFAPAGYFCTRCPTVIVDEAMIRSGIVGKFKYQGVVGIDYDGKKDPDLFRTWNGQPAIFMIDENNNPLGISTTTPTSRPHTKTSHPNKNRRRIEKESRKRNRPKK